MKKEVVIGLGEIGIPILKILSVNHIAIGYDINPKLIDQKKFNQYFDIPINFIHICIPFTSTFEKKILKLIKQFNPRGVVIHSTIKPKTTLNLQKKSKIPVIYSATRGIHRRMLKDLKRYTKFFAVYNWTPKANWATKEYSTLMKKAGIKTKKMSNPLTLELAKIICDTTYYGWLITYSQLSNVIAIQNKVDYDEMWSFADEIHKYLGNRPKMFPGFIGGHCVIQNLKLIDKEDFRKIDNINNLYAKKIKNAKQIAKKYVKGKQS